MEKTIMYFVLILFFSQCNFETHEKDAISDKVTFEVVDSMILDEKTAAFIVYTASNDYDAMEKYANQIANKYGEYSAIVFFNSKEKAPKLTPDGDYTNKNISIAKNIIADAGYSDQFKKRDFWHATDSIPNYQEYLKKTGIIK